MARLDDPARAGQEPSAHDAAVRPGELTALIQDMLRVNEPAWWSMPLSPHQSVGRFEIIREVGRGGFGVVYEAFDTALSRNVALKTVRSAVGADGSRTLAEAEAAARLAHANIVHLYDVGREDRGPYLIMELLHGEALSDRLAQGPLPIRLWATRA